MPLTNEKNKSDLEQNVCHICKKYSLFMTNMIFTKMPVKNTVKSETTVMALENIRVLLIIFEI